MTFHRGKQPSVAMRNAFVAVQEGLLTVSAAARVFNVTQQALHHRVKKVGLLATVKRGYQHALAGNDEARLEQLLAECGSPGNVTWFAFHYSRKEMELNDDLKSGSTGSVTSKVSILKTGRDLFAFNRTVTGKWWFGKRDLFAFTRTVTGRVPIWKTSWFVSIH